VVGYADRAFDSGLPTGCAWTCWTRGRQADHPTL